MAQSELAQEQVLGAAGPSPCSLASLEPAQKTFVGPLRKPEKNPTARGGSESMGPAPR